LLISSPSPSSSLLVVAPAVLLIVKDSAVAVSNSLPPS